MLDMKDVENAKAIMREAVHWSVMRWLAEKKKVRKAADVANALLDELDKEVKSSWSNELKAAYEAISSSGGSPETGRKSKEKQQDISQEIMLLAKDLKQADEEAYRVHMDAEDTFDRAEKRLSTAMAREGTRKAIDSWDLKEKAILKSKAAIGAGRDTL